MARVPAFRSVNETDKAVNKRVHHNNDLCASGRDIPKKERLLGSGNYRLCKHCKNYGT
jgi:hypothetical protein